MKSLIATVVTAAVLVAVVAVFVLTRRGGGTEPDAFAGSYPMVTPAPTGAAATWRPTGRPAGPLPTFPGTASAVTGRITDKQAGVSYARFGAPWHVLTGMISGGRTSGQEIDAKRKDLHHYWYVAVYVGMLDPKFDHPGPQRLRAAAELTGAAFVHELYEDGGTRRDLAGAAMTVDHRPAWVTAFRMTHPAGSPFLEKSQTEVVLAVDTGRVRPAIVEVTVPNIQDSHLPDINRVISSVQVVR